MFNFIQTSLFILIPIFEGHIGFALISIKFVAFCNVDPGYVICYPGLMQGLAETLDGYSRILKNALIVGAEYRIQELALLLDVDPISMTRKGVVVRKDAQLLFLHLEKDKYSTPQYEDHLEGSVLFWSGQNRVKSVEKALMNSSRDTFVFIQKARKTPFIYYGRAIPLRMQIHWEPDVPSHIAFDLFEYAQSLNESADSLIASDNTLIVAEKEPSYGENRVIVNEREAITKIRTSQTLYRNKALELWHHKCAVTAVDNDSWLIASHIKPWHESDDTEKIDPYNSLVLTPNFDKLFDRGVISFSPSTGRIILPETQTREMWNILNRLHIDDTIKLSSVPSKTAAYLEYHNNYVYNFNPNADVSNDDFIEALVAKAYC